MTTETSADARRDELVERLFGNALGAMDLFCVYLGDRLGLYRALADAGPSTSAELASAAGVNERYAREWLEHQAMAGILEALDPSAADAGPPLRPARRPRRGPARRGQSQPHGPDGAAPCGMCPADPRRARGVPNRRRGAVRRLRRRPPRGPGALHPPAVRQPARGRMVSRGDGHPRSPQRRSAGACRRRRVRTRPVERRDRSQLSQGHGRRDRPRSGLDRASSSSFSPQAAWRTA